jgi:hypothetical protein
MYTCMCARACAGGCGGRRMCAGARAGPRPMIRCPVRHGTTIQRYQSLAEQLDDSVILQSVRNRLLQFIFGLFA